MYTCGWILTLLIATIGVVVLVLVYMETPILAAMIASCIYLFISETFGCYTL
jgi:hypothetical protein